MKFTATHLAGAFLIEPQVFTDERGYFFESYHQQKFAQHGITASFVQDNESRSSYGVMRGLHHQAGGFSQAKLIRVLSGEILDIGVDVRLDSPTFGQYMSAKLSAHNKCMLYLPRGFLHGFAVLSEQAIFAYKCDNFWCPQAEFGIRYDDPEIGIAWPIPADQVITSPKDRQANSLQDLIRRTQDLIKRTQGYTQG